MEENAVYSRKENLIAADMNGETVMMDIETGKYYNLGRTGGAIWELLEKPMTLSEITDALLEKYDVDADTCRVQTSKFLDQGIARGLFAKA